MRRCVSRGYMTKGNFGILKDVKMLEPAHNLSSRTKLPGFEVKFILDKETYREYGELARMDLGKNRVISGREKRL